MEYKRLLDKSIVPTDASISTTLAQNYHLWLDVYNYIESMNLFKAETKYFTKNYGWSKRFCKGTKTLCYMFPEAGAFSMLIIFGKDEANRIEEIKDTLKESIYNNFRQTDQFHDGRWVWFRVIDDTDASSIKKILDIKANRTKGKR